MISVKLAELIDLVTEEHDDGLVPVRISSFSRFNESLLQRPLAANSLYIPLWFKGKRAVYNVYEETVKSPSIAL